MKKDLNKIEREVRLHEDNIKSIMEKLHMVMTYLYWVRGTRHQNLKSENVFVDNEEENNKITTIEVNSIFFI